MEFADLSQDGLPATGLSRDDAARRLHVVCDGKLITGLDAFIEIWACLPGFHWLARVAQLPVLRPLLAWGYDRIAAPVLYGLHLRRERRSSELVRAGEDR